MVDVDEENRDGTGDPYCRTGRFFDIPEEASNLANAAAIIVPVPYEATASWLKGTAAGPDAIREASQYVEAWDIETASEPWRYGIAETDAVGCQDLAPEEMAVAVEKATADVLANGRLPIVLGGEHSVTIGAVRAAANASSQLSVLQIDAHADTRESYHGSSHNHGCVMARVREVCPIVQVGIRSLDTDEVAGLDQDRVFWAHDIVGDVSHNWVSDAVDLLSSEVYVTIDVDGFDPAYVPATGTPEPGGLDWYAVNRLLKEVASRRRVVGFDVVELMPGHPPSAFLSAKLIYRFLAEIFQADAATAS